MVEGIRVVEVVRAVEVVRVVEVIMVVGVIMVVEVILVVGMVEVITIVKVVSCSLSRVEGEGCRSTTISNGKHSRHLYFNGGFLFLEVGASDARVCST